MLAEPRRLGLVVSLSRRMFTEKAVSKGLYYKMSVILVLVIHFNSHFVVDIDFPQIVGGVAVHWSCFQKDLVIEDDLSTHLHAQ
jgi:hypothetical protein